MTHLYDEILFPLTFLSIHISVYSAVAITTRLSGLGPICLLFNEVLLCIMANSSSLLLLVIIFSSSITDFLINELSITDFPLKTLLRAPAAGGCKQAATRPAAGAFLSAAASSRPPATDAGGWTVVLLRRKDSV